MVLDTDPQRRISLGLKQTMDNPWMRSLEKHLIDSEMEGEVKNITEFGPFIGLPGEIDGMVHVRSRLGEGKVKKPHEAYKKGDMVKVKVVDIDVEKERISLGVKAIDGRSTGIRDVPDRYPWCGRHPHGLEVMNGGIEAPSPKRRASFVNPIRRGTALSSAPPFCGWRCLCEGHRSTTSVRSTRRSRRRVRLRKRSKLRLITAARCWCIAGEILAPCARSKRNPMTVRLKRRLRKHREEAGEDALKLGPLRKRSPRTLSFVRNDDTERGTVGRPPFFYVDPINAGKPLSIL